MVKLYAKTNAGKVAKATDKLATDIHKNIERALDVDLKTRVGSFQNTLRFIVNEVLREAAQGNNQPQSTAQKIAEEQAIGKTKGLQKNAHDWHSWADDDIIRTFYTPENQGSNLVTRVRTQINPNLDYDDYISGFAKSLEKKIFAIPDSRGNTRYYTIPTHVMEQVLDGVKVFCSKYTDQAGSYRDEEDPLKDIGQIKGREKFERDRERNGYTDFTLKSESLELIRDRGQDITRAVKATQDGKYEDAVEHMNRFEGAAAKKMKERAESAVNGNVTPEAQSLGDINKIINNIHSKKINKKESIEYLLKIVTTGQTFLTDELVNSIKREAAIFASENEGPIRKVVEDAIEKSIARFDKVGYK